MPGRYTLNELADLAAKNSSEAIAKLTGQAVTIEISTVKIRKIRKDYADINPESMVSGVYIPVTGDINGAAILVFSEKVACHLCDLLVRREPGTTSQLTELDKSALKELSNIACGSFLMILSNVLKIRIIEHVPKYCFDMFGAVVDQVISQFALTPDDSLVIEIKFIFDEVLVEGNIILLFGLESMKSIIDILGRSDD